MKKVLLSLALVGLVVGSCDLFGDLDDISFDTDFTASYDVNITNNQASLVKIINLKDDPDIQKYQEKLKDVTVDSVILEVENYVGPVNNKLSGSLGYSEVTSSTPITYAQFQNLALGNGGKVKILGAQTAIDAVQTIMKVKNEIKVYLTGNSTANASFKLNVKFYVTVKAEALD